MACKSTLRVWKKYFVDKIYHFLYPDPSNLLLDGCVGQFAREHTGVKGYAPWFCMLIYHLAKARAVPLHAMKALGGRKEGTAPTHSLDGGEWSASYPGHNLAPGKGLPVPIVQVAGWAPGPVYTQRLGEKFFRLCRGTDLDRPVIQSMARHYTDWAAQSPMYHVEGWTIGQLVIAVQRCNLTPSTWSLSTIATK
jgi:hypothetical protein